MVRRKGFTLIEVLVWLVIVGILAGLLFPIFTKAREKAIWVKDLKEHGWIVVDQWKQCGYRWRICGEVGAPFVPSDDVAKRLYLQRWSLGRGWDGAFSQSGITTIEQFNDALEDLHSEVDDSCNLEAYREDVKARQQRETAASVKELHEWINEAEND